jgi:plastin-1
MAVSKSMSLKDTPELFRLCKEDEELSDLQKLKSEEILIRWINYHLKKNGQSRQVTNLGKDLTDSFALSHVLNRLDKDACSLDTIAGDDYDKKAAADAVVTNSKTIGVPDLVTGDDITAGDDKVLTLFVLNIFNTKHGLEELNEEEYAKCQMIDDDVEGTKEERAFRLWINSLAIEGVYIDNLFDGVSDGWNLCKVVDKIDSSVVNWKIVEQKPKNY